MNCMKCGRETAGDQSFCKDCQLEMERYPVRPGIAVQLPPRREAAVRKPPKRRSVPLEEQIRVLKKRLRTVTIALILCILLCAALFYPAVEHIRENQFAIGQNYSSVTVPSTNADGK